MGNLPFRARVFIILILILASAGLALALSHLSSASAMSWLSTALTVLAVGAATRYSVTLSAKASLVLAQPVVFAAMLVLGTGSAVWITALGVALGYLWQGRKWYNALFNAADWALSLGLAGLFYRTLAPAGPPMLSPTSLIVIAISWLIFFTINSTLVCTLVALHRGQNFAEHWLAIIRRAAREELAFLVLALLMTLAAQQYAWIVVLLVIIGLIACSSGLRLLLLSRSTAR